MTWSAHLQHTDHGLALTFAAPLSRLDMAPDVAAHLASLLAVEARHRMRGIVADYCALAAENKPNGLEALVSFQPTSALCCDCDTCLNGGDHG